MKKIVQLVSFTLLSVAIQAQKTNDEITPLHAMKVDYPVPYEAPSKENVKSVLDKMFHYLDATTPAQMVNKQTGEVINDIDKLDTNSVVKAGDFRLTSYEWGVSTKEENPRWQS